MIDVTPEKAEIFDTNTFETRMSQREYRRIGYMTTRVDNAWGGGFQEAVTTMYVDDKTGLFVADIEAFEKWIGGV